MREIFGVTLQHHLMASAAFVAVVTASPAMAQTRQFNVPAQAASRGIPQFARQAGVQIIASGNVVRGRRTNPVIGSHSVQDGLHMLLNGTGLVAEGGAGGIITIRAGQQSGEAEAGGAAADSGSAAADEVVVTGTRIRGIGPTGSHVDTYNRDDIERQGFGEVVDFIRNLPLNFNGGQSNLTSQVANSTSSLNNFSEGSGINLRGLGNASTLVLLNGQRLAPSGQNGQFVDISVIPVTAIERVEILASGASAIYGSDAVGGVVNFRLREDFSGAETRARYEFATQGGLDSLILGQTLGTTWHGGHALLSYEFSDQDNLSVSQRAFTRNASSPTDLVGSSRRHSVLFAGGQELAENLSLSATVFFSDRNTLRDLTLPPTVPTTHVEAQSRQYGANLGLSYDLGAHTGGDWRIELLGSYSRSESLSDSVRLSTGARQLVSRDSRVQALEANLNGNLFALPAGNVRLAIGAQYRHDFLGNGDVGSRTGSQVLNLGDEFSRDVSAVYGELFVPLVGPANRVGGVNRLELSLAGRYEHYSDFGSSWDPKVGLLWSLVPGLNLRGTYATSFRAPLLTELDDAGSVALLFGGIPNAAGAPKNVLVLAASGNPNLRPETAKTWTAGLDIRPPSIPGLAISATYFDMNYRNRIGIPPFSIATMLTDPRFASLVALGPPSAAILALLQNYQVFNLTPTQVPVASADAVFDGRLTNLAINRVRGIDYSIAYDFSTGGNGRASVSLGGTYLMDFKTRVSPTDTAPDAVGTINNPGALRLTGGAGWSSGGFSVNAFANYVDSYQDTRQIPVTRIDSWTTVNLTLRYDTGDQGARWLRHTIFTLGAINLFDHDPPFVASLRPGSNLNYDPNAANPYGRTVSLQITKRW